MSSEIEASAIDAHPDFSRAALDDLYRYPRKRKSIAWALWILTGFMGGHRFYLDRTGTGLLMLLTGGGALVWWIVDAFLLARMVAKYNLEQKQRERAGRPPVALEFMPSLPEVGDMARRPAWAERRGGLLRLVGDALVLVVAGMTLGAISAEEANFEALAAILLLIAITNFGARWDELARLPVLRQLDRWSHRLRLFYHFNDPGGPLSLLLRPVVGAFTAPFSARARAEVRLYLQLGAVFAIVFTGLDLVGAAALTPSGLDLSIEALAEDLLLTFITVYAFATPIGAVLTAHVLLERSDWVVWLLSGLGIAAIVAGFLAA